MGDAGVLLTVSDHRRAAELAGAIRAAAPTGVVEVVGGFRTVLVTWDPHETDPARCVEELTSIEPRAGAASRAVHRLAVVLDGPDLEEVAASIGRRARALAELFDGCELEVAMVGFSPGFAYLVGLPELLRAVPRRPHPRPRVPAGSFALAGGFAGVYPRSSPGGWQLVGRTCEPLFDPSRPPYARLQGGDCVRLEVVADLPQVADLPRAALEPAGAATLSVLDGGFHTTVQDAGRRGVAHLGVPVGGPADQRAHALANLLVGNRPDAPALEIMARGPRLRCLEPCHVALVGDTTVPEPRPVLVLDDRTVDAGTVVPVAAGQELVVRSSGSGLRAYLSVDGGIGATPVLGSYSMDVLSGLGSGPLRAGDVLGRVSVPGRLADHLVPRGALRRDGDRRWRCRVLPGPDAEWIEPRGLDTLVGQPYRIEGGSDRIGLRLRPQRAALTRRTGELDSQGMVHGAIQVPPSGEPVILGPDHVTLGGYPVGAVVIRADLWQLGQCRPGDTVELVPVSRSEARAALEAEARTRPEVLGHYPSGLDAG